MNGAEKDSERNSKTVTAVAVVSREFAFSLFSPLIALAQILSKPFGV
jgi:hypothetical protein